MASRRGHLQRALGHGLPAHLGEVGSRGQGCGIALPEVRAGEVRAGLGLVSAQLAERSQRVHRHALDGARLPRVLSRDPDRPSPFPLRRRHDRQDAPHRAERPVERQLADEDTLLDRRPSGDLPRGEQQRHRDRQVESGAFLSHVGRGEIHGDLSRREFIAAVPEGGQHALSALAHGRVRQAHDGEGRKPRAEVRLDLDQHSLDAHGGAARHAREQEPRFRGSG